MLGRILKQTSLRTRLHAIPRKNHKIQERNIRMHVERKPGEKMNVDWAGDTGTVSDPKTGGLIKVYIFVASIGVS
jgi:hypothetical protein